MEGNFHELKIWLSSKAKTVSIQVQCPKEDIAAEKKDSGDLQIVPLMYLVEYCSVHTYEKITIHRGRTMGKNNKE